MDKKCKSENCFYLHKTEKNYEYNTKNEAEIALRSLNYKMALKLIKS